MEKLDGREYKVMLEARRLTGQGDGVLTLRKALEAVGRSVGLEVKGHFGMSDTRWIVFLDTHDHAFYRARMILRQRRYDEDERVEITLKAMSPDPFIASSCDVGSANGKGSCGKFEEDIGPPFRSRFARSETIKVPGTRALGEDAACVRDAVKHFRGISKLWGKGDFGDFCAPLRPVNGLRPFETVFKGPRVSLGGTKAKLAVILWTDGPGGKPMVAELSFRYRASDEGVRAATARDAFDFFEAVQRMPWSRPASITKTQYVYLHKSR
jgi:hypothetical protein